MSILETMELPLPANGGGGDGFEPPDDVLERILSFLPTTADAMRASVVARQWRSAWTRLPGLRFETACYGQSSEQAARFTGLVDRALARYACPTMQSLEIIVIHGGYAAAVRAEHATAWLRYARERVAGSFRLVMPKESERRQQLPRQEAGEAIEFPSHGRTKTVTLWLSHATLRFPATPGASEALTELLLGNVRFEHGTGGGHALGDFVSSCCPQLRKLHINRPAGLVMLLLCTESLEELQIMNCRHDFILEVAAPKLRVLHMQFVRNAWTGARGMAKISAPGLEELSWNERRTRAVALLPLAVAFEQTTSVRCLPDVRLDTHYGPTYDNYDHDNRSGIWLLQHCTRADRLLLHLWTPEPSYLLDKYECLLESLPQIPNIKMMTLHVQSWGMVLVRSIATVLTTCSCVQTLHINIDQPLYAICREARAKMDCRLYDKWKIQKISLKALTEVEIRGFTEDKCEINLVRLLLKITETLERIVITVSKGVIPSNQTFRRLAGSPACRRGCWTYDANGFKWVRKAGQ